MALEFLEEPEEGKEEAPPSLAEAIRRAISSATMELRVAMPGKVVRYDKEKQVVDVQPVFKRKYKDGSVTDPPVIYSVPVAFPRAGDAFIALPLKPGHSVLLIFSDRSLEKWSSAGDLHEPEDTRTHDISDAVAYPGTYPGSSPVPVNNDDDIIISNGKGEGRTEMRIKPNGHFQIINKNFEFLKILDEWIRADIVGAHQALLATRRKLKTFVEK